MKTYLAKKQKGQYVFTSALLLKDPSQIKIIDNPARINILKLLSKKSLFPAEIAKEMKLHEQKVYYHLKQMDNAGLIEVIEKKDIRGTTAKKFAAKEKSFAFTITDDWEDMPIESKDEDPKLERFLEPFIKNCRFNARIIVGSPEPHGPHKAIAKDGHYGIDLALFFGQYARMPEKSVVSLDVNNKLEHSPENTIIVGGPVTNMTGKVINADLPVKFSESPPWGLISNKTGKEYTEENTGIIAKIPHPYSKEHSIMYLAGIRGRGTKSAVLALVTKYEELLKTYAKQKKWAAVVQGFDLDGDGKIDSIDIIEA